MFFDLKIKKQMFFLWPYQRIGQEGQGQAGDADDGFA